jgi:hypothetical protein
MRTFDRSASGKAIKHKLDRKIALQWQRMGQSVYIVVNPGGDTDADITVCVALFCEWDNQTVEWQLNAWKELNLPEPTMQVLTGGKSVHNYWVFEKPVDVDVWRDLQTRLIAHANSDTQLKNPSRVMRLPGCWHIKNGVVGDIATIVHTSDTRINPVDFDAVLPNKAQVQRMVEVQNFRLPTDWEPRSFDEIKKALSCVPQRVSGNDNYAEYRNLLWGLGRALTEINRDPAEAVELMEAHSPSAVSGWNVAQVFHSGGHSAQSSWFWRIASLYGYSLSRKPASQPRMPSLPTGKDIDTLTVDDLLGPIEDDKLRNPRADRLRLLMEVIFQPKFNQLTGDFEVASGDYIDNAWLDSLYLKLAEDHHVCINDKRAKDAFVYAARKNTYHPVHDYLNGLATRCEPLPTDDWELIAHTVFGAEDPNANMYLRRQLIAAVARVKDPGCKVDTALVTHGKQGIYKSEFWSVMGGKWFSDALGPLSNMKDDQLLLHGAWIHEWGEIDRVVGKKENEAVKHFITIREDRVRPPYGRKPETWKRQCIIVGTTNRDDFIKDHTGNRRFPIFTASHVDIDWVRERRDAIWLRALTEYREGTRWWYDADETEVINATAQGYAAEDQFLEALEPHAEGLSEVNIPTLCMTIKGWDKYIDDAGARKKIGYALNRLGFVRDPNDKRTVSVPTRGSIRVCIFHRDTFAKGG